jgi:uncharacterized membrane protein (UPF0127 family)
VRFSPPRLASVPRHLAATWLLAVMVLAAASCRSGGTEPVVVVHADSGAVPVRVELARTREELSRGLMWRDRMDADAGMLFVFDAADERTFWMKNTPLSLDIIFIGEDLRVRNVAEATAPYSETPIPSAGAVRYVLEVRAGFARLHGIRAGTRVELPVRHAVGGGG